MSHNNQEEERPKSMISQNHLPEINKIIPYAAKFLDPTPRQTKKKKKLLVPRYVCMNWKDVRSVLNGFLFPWKFLCGKNTKILSKFVTSQIYPVHQYHCFQFMKKYTPEIVFTIGPRDMLRYLDLIALCTYKYITQILSLRMYEPSADSEWNKQDLYQHYVKDNNGKLIPISPIEEEDELPSKPPMEITKPEFRIHKYHFPKYDDIIHTTTFFLCLKHGYWLQEILSYIGEIHGFNIFSLLNLKESENLLDSGIPDKKKECKDYDYETDGYNRETKLKFKLRNQMRRENEAREK